MKLWTKIVLQQFSKGRSVLQHDVFVCREERIGGEDMKENPPVLQLEQLSKKIGNKWIVEDVSFEVPRGEVFGFLGPNGAGKTTTIRMIVGLMKMSRGEVRINDISVHQHFEKAMRQVGAIVENPEMYKYLSGYRNLLHYCRMYKGISKERINEVVELVGLQKRIREKVKTYSLGMRQRLGVAQALLHKPAVLILDEPTNGLDPAGIRELRDYLRRIVREEGISVVVSSHLLSEMELMCDRVAILQHGQLIDVRKIKEDAEQEKSARWMAFDTDLVMKKDAEAAVKALLTEQDLRWTKQGFEIEIAREQIPVVNRALVEKDIPVYAIRAVSKTLEDQFLEITGGGPIA